MKVPDTGEEDDLKITQVNAKNMKQSTRADVNASSGRGHSGHLA